MKSFSYFTGGIDVKKRLIAGILIFFILSISGTICYADNIINRDSDEIGRVENGRYFFEILEPEKNISTTDKNILLSFRASRGTDVRIEVYYNSSMEEDIENYTLLYEPIDITVGVLRRGWASVDLRSGLNKIHFIIEYRNGLEDNMERIINVMEIEDVKQLLQDIVNKSTLGIWNK